MILDLVQRFLVSRYSTATTKLITWSGGNHDIGSIETKQQPATPIIVQITQIVLLIVAHEASLLLIVGL
jgi:hypothetical protein